jgi:hypothetical protein
LRTGHCCPMSKHRTSRYLNNRAENSQRLTRRRERQMQRFKSPRQAQDFLSAHAIIYRYFRPQRHRFSAVHCRRSSDQSGSDLTTGDVCPTGVIRLRTLTPLAATRSASG